MIRCGAQVNAVDHNGNTPLHLIVNYHKAVTDFPTLHAIITALTENGAHTDSVNKRGETPLVAAATGSKCFSYRLDLLQIREDSGRELN